MNALTYRFDGCLEYTDVLQVELSCVMAVISAFV